MPPEKDLEQHEVGVRLGNYENSLKHVFRHLATTITKRAIPVSSFALAARARLQTETGTGGRSVMNNGIRDSNFAI